MNQIPILDLAASAAAVLLFLFAARSFVTGSNREPLGWGFGVASGLILAYLVRDKVGGFDNGIRIGIGILFALPALHALVDPRSTSIVSAVFGLVLAFAVAGNPVRDLISSLGPPTPRSELSIVQDQVQHFERQKQRAQKILQDLVLKKEELKREVKSLGLRDEALFDHPKTQLLAATIEAQEKWEQALVIIDGELQAKRLRVQAIEAGMEIERMSEQNPELVDLFKDLDQTTLDPENLSLLERTVYRDRIREILDKELP